MEVVLGCGFCSLENGFHALLRNLISIRHSNRGSAVEFILVRSQKKHKISYEERENRVGLVCFVVWGRRKRST